MEEHLFHGEKHPDMFRRRFRPSRRKLKNLSTSVRLEKRHSKIDQANVEVQWNLSKVDTYGTGVFVCFREVSVYIFVILLYNYSQSCFKKIYFFRCSSSCPLLSCKKTQLIFSSRSLHGSNFAFLISFDQCILSISKIKYRKTIFSTIKVCYE